MISVKLCISTSERNAVNKEIEEKTTVNCIFKEGTSLLNPVLLLKLDALPDFNYVIIEEVTRNYFVNGVKSVNGNLWEIQCSVDVLTSFKNEILENVAIIDRQENNWNLYLNDNSFRAYQNPYIVQKEFPVGFNPSVGSYCLLIAGNAETETETTE